MVELTLHAKSVDLARRFTAQNDHDLMHSCMEETIGPVGTYRENSERPLHISAARRLILTGPITEQTEPTSPRKYDHDSCQELASHLITAKGLPFQCTKYTDVVMNVRRRESDRTDGTEILS